MKRILVILAIASFIIPSAQAQLVKFGIRGGINISGLSGKNIGDIVENDMTGFHIGPTAELLLTNSSRIEGSILYSQKGIKFKDDNSHKTGYIEIPVNYKHKFSLLGPVKPYLKAGPYISFKVSGDDNFEGGISGVKEQWEAKSFGAGLNFGAGVEVINMIEFGFNFGLGLTDNYKGGIKDLTAKERTWSIAAAVYF